MTCFVQNCDCPGVAYHFDSKPMVVTARPKDAVNIPHGPRLAREFGFEQIDDYVEKDPTTPHSTRRVLVFRADRPHPDYAEWFIDGLKHYEMVVEVS